jgi:aldehyde dehydrogenase (NAD+)
MSVRDILETMDYGPAPEARDQADSWIARHGGSFKLFIDGKWRAAKSGATFATTNPADGQKLAKISRAGKADINAAVRAARKAQADWSALSGHARARYLYALARLVQKHARLLSVVETLDNGKSIRETRDIDVPLVARHFYHHAGWAQLLHTEFPDHAAVGVVGQIIPWNFPLLMLAWKIAPALAAGNTVVLKPAEYTSLTALLFAEICQEAGLPPGVVNIVTGDGSTGELIVNHPDVNKIAFTGSTDVGRRIRSATAGSGKKISLELGGKSPFIVFDDADIDGAVEGLVDAIWFNQGQVCCAGSRLLVQENIAVKLLDKLRARMATLRVGNPLDKAIDMGAIVDPVQWKAIDRLVKIGVDEGAELWQSDSDLPKKGCFYPPTLLTGVEAASTVAREEIFGPVLVSMTFRTPGEAVAMANDTRYGLAASIWTENINLALDVAPKIKAGVIWINSTNQFDAAVGFGGYRESGFGREGGLEGLYEYLRAKDAGVTAAPAKAKASKVAGSPTTGVPSLDRTAKLYVGGKQARPDGGYSLPITGADGSLLGHVGDGNRKDIRNAVEAARKAEAWSGASTHNRAQVIYYIGENLSARSSEFADRLREMTGCTARAALREVETSVERLFTYGAWADKYDGAVHSPPLRGVALAMNEPLGVMGIACPDEAPLLAFVSLMAPAIAMGNRVVVVPSPVYPLSATDFYQVLETSDVPGGVVNIVTGARDPLAKVLAEHDEVSGVWYAGTTEGSADVERASAGDLKQTWVNNGQACDWYDHKQSEGRMYLRHATLVKNIWIPYGE